MCQGTSRAGIGSTTGYRSSSATTERELLKSVRPLSRAVEEGEYFDLTAADSIRNEEGSGDDYEFAASGNAARPSSRGKTFQQFNGRENALEHGVSRDRRAFAGPVVVSGAQVT